MLTTEAFNAFLKTWQSPGDLFVHHRSLRLPRDHFAASGLISICSV